jgi:hypothetical protein
MSISNLSQTITTNSAGIIWLTDEDLNYDLKGVYEFNYLLDGLLLKTIENNDESNKNHNFFLTTNFGKSFFIGHIKITNKNDLNLINQHIKLAIPLLKNQNEICIYNRSQNTANINVLKELKSQHPEFEFRHLVL